MMDTETSFNKWFRTEMGVAFAIGAAVSGILVWFMVPVYSLNTQVAVIQNQIAEIKSNDLTHIELIQQQIQTRLDTQQIQINDMDNKITEILVTLKK